MLQMNIMKSSSVALRSLLLALPLAAAGMIAPWLAAIGMSLSSLLVVVNALRLAGRDAVGRGAQG